MTRATYDQVLAKIHDARTRMFDALNASYDATSETEYNAFLEMAFKAGNDYNVWQTVKDALDKGGQ